MAGASDQNSYGGEMKRTQSQRILDYLATGKSLTPLEALHKFGCLRLGARIYDLRCAGHKIKSHLYRTRSGANVGEYWLL